MVFIDRGHIITSAGEGVAKNAEMLFAGNHLFNAQYQSKSGVTYPVGRLEPSMNLEEGLKSILVHYQSKFSDLETGRRTKLIITTTKGGVGGDPNAKGIVEIVYNVLKRFEPLSNPWIISNACVSGVMGIIHGTNLIRSGMYDHALVIGIDFATDFILDGFESLHAMSADLCRPFDAKRTGINLSDAIAAVWLSKDKSSNEKGDFEVLGGASANDANHISGPSRTGEGLYRSVSDALRQSGVALEEIGYINAHGTGTMYNDEMESIAFDRLGMGKIPVNSLKGYFGHTLGAAGVLETVLAMEQVSKGKLLANRLLSEKGVSGDINLLANIEASQSPVFLKTSSGFGGINSSIILKQCL